MISAATLNSELINKIAQDFAQATSLAVVVVNIHGDEISELFNFTPFCQMMRQHPQLSTRCRMSDRCGDLPASNHRHSEYRPNRHHHYADELARTIQNQLNARRLPVE